MKAKSLGELLEPGEPPHAIARLIGEKNHHNEEIDGQGKDLRAEDGLADALDGGVAAAELSAPPERAGSADAGCAGSLGTRALKGLCHQSQVTARTAGAQMGAQFRRTGCRPLAETEQLSH